MIDFLNELNFVWRSLIAGVAIGIVAGPIGVFLIWRRMSFLGETIAHASMLGISISLLLDINFYFGLFFVAILVAFLLNYLSLNKELAPDAILALLAHSSLALGILVIPTSQLNIMEFLFGDILAVSGTDIAMIVSVSASCCLALKVIWPDLILLTINEDLATAENVPVGTTKLIYLFCVALVFAVAIKVIGILLITSMLVIPALAARSFAKDSESMVWCSSLMATLSVFGGVGISCVWDLSTGPAIVVFCALLFLLSQLLKSLKIRLL